MMTQPRKLILRNPKLLTASCDVARGGGQMLVIGSRFTVLKRQGQRQAAIMKVGDFNRNRLGGPA